MTVLAQYPATAAGLVALFCFGLAGEVALSVMALLVAMLAYATEHP